MVLLRPGWTTSSEVTYKDPDPVIDRYLIIPEGQEILVRHKFLRTVRCHKSRFVNNLLRSRLERGRN